MVDHGRHRTLVEAQLRVREVVVVEQQDVGRGQPGQRRDRRCGCRRCRPRSGRAGPAANRPGRTGRRRSGAVRSVGYRPAPPAAPRPTCTCRPAPIVTSGRSVLTWAVSSHCAANLRSSRPEAASSADSRSSKVALPQACSAKYARSPVDERSDPHVRDELLDHARALGVRDAVEVDLDRLDVGHLAVDRVGRGELVLPVAPVLAHRQERRPRVGEPGRLGVAPVAGPLGERLVQPQVVPPAHGHQVAEPHVGQLVQDRVGAVLVLVVGDLRAEDVVLLGVDDAAEVLHRAGVEVGHEELVVLGQRVAHAELLVEEVEALLGDQEDVVGVEVARHRGPAEHAEVDAVVRRRAPRGTGPAHIAVMYVLIRADGAKCTVFAPGPAGSADARRPACWRPPSSAPARSRAR